MEASRDRLREPSPNCSPGRTDSDLKFPAFTVPLGWLALRSIKLEDMEDPLDLQYIEDRMAEYKRSHDQEIRTPEQPGKVSWPIMEAALRALLIGHLRAEKEKK
jgi:hypothetical protein